MTDTIKNPNCCCGNCKWKGSLLNLNPVKDLHERIDPGVTTVPAGECPECGAFAYINTEHDEWEMRRTRLHYFPDVLEMLDNVAVALETVLINNVSDPMTPVVVSLRPRMPNYKNLAALVGRANMLVRDARSDTSCGRKRYNTMFDVAFTVEHGCEDAEDVPVALIIKGLEKRLCDLKEMSSEDSGREDAFGISDTYEIEE